MSSAEMKYDRNFKQPKSLSNQNLQKIIRFYLLECPVEGKSRRGKTFQEYGFRGSSSFSRLKAALLNSATTSLRKHYYPCKKEELSASFELCDVLGYPDEYCVFLKSDEKSVVRSMFSAIRNALAHGSFNVNSYKGTRVYFFSNYKDYEKARIVLHETTLLSWISIITAGRID